MAVAVALMVTVVGPPNICMKARGSGCVVERVNWYPLNWVLVATTVSW